MPEVPNVGLVNFEQVQRKIPGGLSSLAWQVLASTQDASLDTVQRSVGLGPHVPYRRKCLLNFALIAAPRAGCRFCRSWIAIISFRRERGLMVFFPRLKLLIAHSASLDRRDRSLVENCFVSARICSKYFGSTTLSYSRKVSSTVSMAPASAIIDKSRPVAQRVDASLPW